MPAHRGHRSALAAKARQPAWAIGLERYFKEKPMEKLREAARAFRWLAEQLEEEVQARQAAGQRNQRTREDNRGGGSSSRADREALRFNDEGFPATLGDGAGRYYCGRTLGDDVIPDSDGVCGPTGGPQCPSCRRLQSGLLPQP